VNTQLEAEIGAEVDTEIDTEEDQAAGLAPHGTRKRHGQGCKGPRCRAAYNATMRENRAARRRRAAENPESIPHGTPGAYTNHACRCDACFEAYYGHPRIRLTGTTETVAETAPAESSSSTAD